MMNKKAETSMEILNLTWRILILTAIVLVTVSALSTVFSSKQDVRSAEAMLLARAVTECIAPNGIADENFNLGKCIATTAEGYFVNATLFSSDSSFSKSESFDIKSIQTDCAIAARGLSYTNAPVCTSSKSYVLISDKEGLKRGILEVRAGIRKVASNV